MTAGTVVITGGIIAAVILLTIVTVLCCCRLQYYCCKHDGSEEEEEEKTEFSKNFPSPAHQSDPPNHSCSPQAPSPPTFETSPSALSILSLPEHSNQLHTTPELHKPNTQTICRRYSPTVFPGPIYSYMLCPSCSGLLPFYLSQEKGVRNGGGGISYRSLEQQQVDLPMDISSFNKLNLIHSITMREVVTHQSISTDV